MKIINLTPHKIDFLVEDENGQIMNADGKTYSIKRTIKSSGSARCQMDNNVIDIINGIDVIKPKFGQIYHLPDPEDSTIYITSRIVADAAKSQGREDVYCVGQTVREGSFILGALNIVKPF